MRTGKGLLSGCSGVALLAGKVVLAAVGQVEQAEDIEQGTFAGAGRAEDAAAVAAGDGQADIIKNGQVLPGQLIAFADALQGNQAWVRGGICHHDYAFSLDGAALPRKSLFTISGTAWYASRTGFISCF